MDRRLFDRYPNHLIESNSILKAPGMVDLMDRVVAYSQASHSGGSSIEPREWWQMVKSTVRNMQEEGGFITIFDCTIELPGADESELINWHYDFSLGRAVKGINLISALYTIDEVSIPITFRLATKTEWVTDNQGNRKRSSNVSKSQHYRSLLHTCMRNQIPFLYILNDFWFASSENMKYVKQKLRKDFFMALKSNRKIAFSLEEKQQGHFHTLDQLALPEDIVTVAFLAQIQFPLYLLPQTSMNPDGSTGLNYFVTSDATLAA